MCNGKSHNAHLIFVKNVPGHLWAEGIPRLFNEYKPLETKNIFPGNSITTVVLRFSSHAEALRAKEGVHDKRLGNAVLRTEMYEDRRSIRFNRAPEQAPTYTIRKPRSKKNLVPAKAPNMIAGNTWATIASRPRIEKCSELPDLPTTSSPKTAQAYVDQTGTTGTAPPNNPLSEEENPFLDLPADAPREEFAESDPDATDEDSDESPEDWSLVTAPDTASYNAHSTAHTTPEKGASKATVADSDQENTVRNNAAPAQPPINISFAYDSNAHNTSGPSQIVDTTVHIQANHQPHCAFCVKRDAAKLRASERNATEPRENGPWNRE
ncbi:hypothetical protein TUN205_10469 [Pyrenophora tritici-repentis]|nr:hypothetical protein TUN205_10469 [Pyrenophora tritici-repentis]